MTQDEIIEMARRAEFVNLDLCSSELKRFAKLVAEKERGEFAPAPTVFNDLTSLKHKQTVGANWRLAKPMEVRK